jgi:hypothetical protein
VIRAVILIALVALPHRALAQACCAGSSAVTPGRLALHEDALVGLDARITGAYGSFDPTGTFVTTPSGASETDFEEDAFAAIRLFERGQAALLVPLVETRRTANGDSEFGGGIGDINLSARYDFVYAGEARYVPGIGLLVGITFPTGTPPESATKPLATDATGVGAYQANLGLSFEKTIGPWLFGLSGIVAKRTTRTAEGVTEALASQWTVLAAAAYTFTAEGNASVDDMEQADTRRRLVAISASGLFPISDHLRLQGALTVDPPVGSFGINQPSAGIGGTVTAIYAWL